MARYLSLRFMSYSVVCLLLMGFSLGLVDLALAEDTSRGLRLDLSVVKREVYVGEPVVLRIALVNGSDSTVRVPVLLHPSGRRLDILVSSERDSSVSYLKYHGHFVCWIPTYRPLAPGDSLYGFVTLLYWDKGGGESKFLMMPEPGRYLLTATYESSSWLGEVDLHSPAIIRLRSGEVEVLVKATPEGELEAREVFLSDNTDIFIKTDMEDYPPPVIDAYSEVVARWPESVYAGYALYYLARIDFTRRDYKKAIEKYERLLSDYEGTPYWESARIELALSRVQGAGADMSILYELPRGYRRNRFLHRWLRILEIEKSKLRE